MFSHTEMTDSLHEITEVPRLLAQRSSTLLDVLEFP